MKRFSIGSVLILIVSMLVSGCGGGGSSSAATPQTATLNPAFDFYINRAWNTDTDSLWGYGTDAVGTFTDGTTGSGTGISGGVHYQNFFKLLYNFDISTLNGATIQSATFRVYMHDLGGADSPQNAMLENIFYGNTGGFPTVRNYDNEFGGYTVAPTIAATADVTAAGWKTFDVTAKLQADVIAGRTNSQLRLSHVNATSLLNYDCSWYMADNATNRPELVITYTK